MAALTHGPQLRTPGYDSLTVWARLDGAGTVVLQTRLNGATTWVTADTDTADVTLHNSVLLTASGLSARTAYEYRLVVDGVAGTTYDTITMPRPSGGRVVIYQLSDEHDESDEAVTVSYAAVLAHYQANYEPLGVPAVVIQHGDLYEFGSAASLDTNVAEALGVVGEMHPCTATLPVLFMWDDWDFAGNNSSKDWTLGYTVNADAPLLWNSVWRGYPQPAAPSRGYIVELAGVPVCLLDGRSQRTSQTGPVPLLTGGEALSDSITALGLAQRNWAVTQLYGYSERGLILLVSGTTFKDNEVAAPIVGTPPSGSPVRDSVGLYFKAERNLLVTAATAGANRPTLCVLSGDDHRNSVWGTVAREPAPRALPPGRSTGKRFREFKVNCGNSNPVGGSSTIFGNGNLFEWSGTQFDALVVWDITSANGGRNVAARIRYLHITGTQNPPGAMAVPTDSAGNLADWYYENGVMRPYADAQVEQNQLYPPDNGQFGITFNKWYTDDISGAMYSRVNIERDVYERLRFFKDVEDEDRDELQRRYEPRTEREFDEL